MGHVSEVVMGDGRETGPLVGYEPRVVALVGVLGLARGAVKDDAGLAVRSRRRDTLAR